MTIMIIELPDWIRCSAEQKAALGEVTLPELIVGLLAAVSAGSNPGPENEFQEWREELL